MVCGLRPIEFYEIPIYLHTLLPSYCTELQDTLCACLAPYLVFFRRVYFQSRINPILKLTFNKIDRKLGSLCKKKGQKLWTIGRIGLEVKFFGVTLNLMQRLIIKYWTDQSVQILADFSQFLVNIFWTMTPTSYRAY